MDTSLKEHNTVKVIIPHVSGGLWQALKRSAEVENDLDVLSDPKKADDKYWSSWQKLLILRAGKRDDKRSSSWKAFLHIDSSIDTYQASRNIQ